jgi:hypothetical protein
MKKKKKIIKINNNNYNKPPFLEMIKSKFVAHIFRLMKKIITDEKLLKLLELTFQE